METKVASIILGSFILAGGVIIFNQYQEIAKLKIELKLQELKYRNLMKDLENQIDRLQYELNEARFNQSLLERSLAKMHTDLEKNRDLLNRSQNQLKELRQRLDSSIELSQESYRKFLEFLVREHSNLIGVNVTLSMLPEITVPGCIAAAGCYISWSKEIQIDEDEVGRAIENPNLYKFSPMYLVWHEFAHVAQDVLGLSFNETQAYKIADRCFLRFLETRDPICNIMDELIKLR